ncbi:MAG: hypothetical protein JNL96_27330, partial [Planctomycetaceae bacterium]|nr:hypothetical protein [Planctomycetales bacterium]MBL9094960.1 hypothetical protein [Planctomycetaceae bacterium]
MNDRQFCGRTRREFLWQTGGGFGAAALTGMLGADGFFDSRVKGSEAKAAGHAMPTTFVNPLA